MHRLARKGHLPVRRIGRRVVISESRLAEWMNGIGDVHAQYYEGASLQPAKISTPPT